MLRLVFKCAERACGLVLLDDTLSQLVAAVDGSRQHLWSALPTMGDDERTG